MTRKPTGVSRALLLRSLVSLEASLPKEFEANGKWRLRRTDIVGNIAATALTDPCFFRRWRRPFFSLGWLPALLNLTYAHFSMKC